jgi:sarcosine oxidase, subunit alpha
MNVRTGRLAGVDGCVLWRIGFTGELSYELHVPAGYGLHVWEALLDHGRDLGVAPFGIEAQRILRLEKGHAIVGQDTDGLTKAYSAGLDSLVKLDKDDFAGRPELLWQHEDGTGPRLVGLQPVDGSVVPPEASQIVENGRILGRITSSRMSPTLNRSVCLAQIEATHATAGTEVTVLLPDGRPIAARVTAQPAHVDPEGRRLRHRSDAPGDPAHTGETPVARRAVTLPDADIEPGVTLADAGPLAAVAVRAPGDGVVATTLGPGFGRAVRNVHGDLVVGSGPGEWLVLAEPGTQDELRTRLEELASSGEFVTVVDLSHGRALLRLSGERSADLLATVCAINLADDAVPDGAALRTSVAKIVTDIVRDDQGAVPSYLLHCERSSGQYLAEVLLDAGARPVPSSPR